MSFSTTLPAHLRPRRAKLFTDGRQTPIDRNDRARGMWLAQMARRRGEITRAAVDIFRAFLFTFANLEDGRCFPVLRTHCRRRRMRPPHRGALPSRP